MITEADLDTRLRAMDPQPDNLFSDREISALNRLTHDAKNAARAQTRRRVGVTSGALAIAIGLGVTAAPAAAGLSQRFLAQLDWVGSGTEWIPGSESVDLGAADFDEYVDFTLHDTLPLPDGTTHAELVDEVARIMASSNTITQQVGITRQYERLARLAWMDYWLLADDEGDLVERDAASRVLVESASWPAHVATDGGGVTAMLAVFARHATEGDRTYVEAWRSDEMGLYDTEPAFEAIYIDVYEEAHE